MNQPGLGETNGRAAEIDKLLMQMTLKPRNQQDNSQKQPSLVAAENAADSTNIYKGGENKWEKSIEKTQVKNWRLTKS